MRRGRFLVAAVLATVAFGGGTSALAANPHFISATSSVSSSGALSVAFKMAGLGTGQSVTFTLSADATALYGCQNKGGRFPDDWLRQVSGPVVAFDDFQTSDDGGVDGTLSVAAPTTTFACPGKLRLAFISVDYSDVELSGAGISVIFT